MKMRDLFISENKTKPTMKASNLRARSARGAEGVVAAAHLDDHPGGQVDAGAVQSVGLGLLQNSKFITTFSRL